MPIPSRQPGQSFDAHQAEVAAWLGCTVERMNADHDALHEELCGAFGVESRAMRDARGEVINEADRHIANLEEEAVLHVQRWLVACHG